MTLDIEALSIRFEGQLRQVAVADSPFVTEAASHLIAAGGKWFRPQLVYLASGFGGEVDEEQLLKAVLMMELIHVASLYHDDVMDGADVCRSAPSANSRWGNSIAILIGDYLFVRTSILVTDLGADYVRFQVEAFTRLVQGQVMETRGPGTGEAPLERYLQVITDKTSSLIAASALFGAMIAGVPQGIREALAAYGEEIGLVFQLSDDIIDITSDVTGKTPGTGLREGVPTLPTLLLGASRDPVDQLLKDLLARGLSDDAALAETLAVLCAHSVVEKARAEVCRHADLTRQHLAPLPEGDTKQLLLQACGDLVKRSA